MSLLSRSTDTFYAFRFLRLLTTPWEETKAFEAGLLDKDGKQIRKPANGDERSVLNIFHRLVFNIKRLLNKLPAGKSKLASYLSALYLIKEHTGMEDEEILGILREATNQPNLTLPLSEATTDKHLGQGEYTLRESVPMPKTGEMLTRSGDDILVRNDLSPHGTILNVPVFEVLHVPTNSKILVTQSDIS